MRIPARTCCLLAATIVAMPWCRASASEGLQASRRTPELVGRWGETVAPAQLINRSPQRPTKALVVIACSVTCPLVQRLVPALNELQETYREQGVQFIGLFPNGSDELHEIAEYALDAGLVFPVYKDDADSPWYQSLGLTTTPSVAVIDMLSPESETPPGPSPQFHLPLGQLVYRGQVDGMWAGGGGKRKTPFLADALAAWSKGEPPLLGETAASGCIIQPVAFRDLRPHAGVTFYRDIAPMLQSHCLSCHRSGEAGAELFMDFESYENAAAASQTMLQRMEQRLMPPWHASLGPESGIESFLHDLRLTADQIDRFRAWTLADCPPGDPRDAPSPLPEVPPGAWQIGEPDFVFTMPEPYEVPLTQLDDYVYYRIPVNFPTDRYLQAVELRPGNKAVVHHMGAIVGPASARPSTPSETMLALYGLTGDRVRKIGDYIPGDPFNAHTYPPGTALKLPAGHDLFFEMHYTPTGRQEAPDVSQLGIRWAPGPPERLLETQVFNRKDIRLRPHDGHYEKSNFYQFSTDVLIHALAPHMHFRGRDFVLYKIENPQTPDERRTLILKMPIYDFNWQRTYEFANPLPLKAGDVLYGVAHFDNSIYNPHNPDPEEMVRYGLKSEQEMFNLRVKFERTEAL
jgi:hypothetical protein